MLRMSSTLTTLDAPRRLVVKADAPFHTDEQLDNPAKLDDDDLECVAHEASATAAPSGAHDLSKLLDDPRTLAERDAVAPDVARAAAPLLAASAGWAGPVSRRDDLDVDDTLHALRGGES